MICMGSTKSVELVALHTEHLVLAIPNLLADIAK